MDPPLEWKARFPEEAARVADAAPSRRAEFFSGRDCARRCLAGLGQAEVAIPSDETGLPVWPEGVTGSITHSRGLCLAVAAASKDLTALGIDLERTGRMSEAAAKRVLHPDERTFVGADGDRATLLFSLKEAFFKCQYPHFRAHPGFRDVAFAVDEAAGAARIVCSDPGLPPGLREASGRMDFGYRSSSDFIVSLAWLR